MGKNARNSLEINGWKLRSLEDCEYSNFDYFNCDNADLNDFFKNDALAYKKELLVETYCFEYQDQPVALISFRNDSLDLSLRQRKRMLPDAKTKFVSLPAVKIARLGVQKEYQRKSVGTNLLNFCKRLF